MQRQQGVTLVELLVTLAVLAVLVGVVFPGFQAIVTQNNLATTANRMVLAVSYARSEAVRISGPIRMQAIDDSDGDNEWGPGWVVEEMDDTLLRTFEGAPDPLTLDSADDLDEVVFDARGAVQGGVNLTFDLCIPDDDGVRIIITAIGRVDTRDIDC
ncbi:MAG: GspH/FimT family pseudopilin [Pseudomonadales bacterium]|jgi:type IV fimbrial biogenesis protein FimT|nr:GspH/FimT family pseudopilin [Pseudomonadales bacterium]